MQSTWHVIVLLQMTLVVSVAMGLLLSLSVAQQVGTQHVLCGRTLADMLDLVCAGRGFHFNKRSGRH